MIQTQISDNPSYLRMSSYYYRLRRYRYRLRYRIARTDLCELADVLICVMICVSL